MRTNVLSAGVKSDRTEALAASEEANGELPMLFGTLKRFAYEEQNTGWAQPSANTLTWLQNASTYQDSSGSAMAEAWLVALGGTQSTETIILPREVRSFANNSRVQAAGQEDLSLLLFPNPTTDEVKVAYHLPEDLENVSLIIRDMLGRKISDLPSGNGIQLLDISIDALNDGMYLVSLEADGYKLATQRLIVTR